MARVLKASPKTVTPSSLLAKALDLLESPEAKNIRLAQPGIISPAHFMSRTPPQTGIGGSVLQRRDVTASCVPCGGVL